MVDTAVEDVDLLESKAPIPVTPTPATELQPTPVVQEKSPVVQEKTPVVQEKTPDVQEKTPDVQEQAQDVHEQAQDDQAQAAGQLQPQKQEHEQQPEQVQAHEQDTLVQQQDAQQRDTKEASEVGSKDSHGNNSDSDFEEPQSFGIKLNPVAKKTGRPALDKTKKAATVRGQRLIYRQAEAARRDIGEVTLEDVLRNLDSTTPSLAAALTRLRKIPTKFGKEESRRPKYELIARPVLNEDAFYLLPKKLLKASIKCLPIQNTWEDAIYVASQSQSSQSQVSVDSQDVKQDEKQEVVTIASVGSFSRRRIEVMMQLLNLREACEEGESFVRWLRQVATRVPQSMQNQVGRIADLVSSSYPSTRIEGLDQSEYVMSMLFRFQPPREFNDGIIRALCDRIKLTYPGAHHAGMPVGKPKSKMQTRQHLPPSLIDRIKALSNDQAVQTLLLPVNFGNTHWCGVIVDVQNKRVCYYDSLSSPHYKSALDDIAQIIAKDAMPGFNIVALNTPVQFDGYSCGFFVCMKFWRFVDPSISQDMTPNSIDTRRIELLRFIISGKKPSDDADS